MSSWMLTKVTLTGLREFLASLATYFAAFSEDLEPSIGSSIFIGLFTLSLFKLHVFSLRQIQ
jgi:hypothetical protein